jgi:hypothetical protein
LVQSALVIWAGWVVFHSSAYTGGQRAAQLGLATSMPLLGAMLVLFMARRAVEAFPSPASKFTVQGD